MSSNDYSKLLRSYNWTGEINSRLPTTYVVADGDGFYTLRYSFFQNYSDHEISPDYDESDPEFKILESGFVIQPLSQTQESLVNTFLSGPFTEFDVFFGSVANVKFEQGGLSDSHITIGNLDISYAGFQNNAHGGGYAYNWAPSSSYPEGRYGDIWFNQDMDTDQNGQPDWESGDATVGSKVYLTVLHELAHAMGLADISSTSLKGTYMDSHKYSIMTSTYAPGMEFTPGGLQLLDIAALQAIYGVNTETRKEDTVYDIYGGAFASAKQHGAFLYTIWDGGGIDTIDVSGFSSLGFGAEIDLREGRFSSIGLDRYF
ncbi:MAG: M10 family metallopeptidase C-terminal domain-containing protein [Micavibrio aeruginosavorus]|uniref:M10 family metallopeptidase C-terminal domain-containing protein n=1 Tax=Micavibrio aeruginosavorus TaxID=349221 RepID=A0A7T5R1C0_9BACT|nr:MAG: M10 family metallopeptidase C-terminal domain-containing protein [Micavibrio aeruginosavorus]